MKLSSSHKKAWLCRLFGHRPGIETWPICVCWCERCGARCDRFGRALAEPLNPPGFTTPEGRA